ncbi:HlyD family secretion protein [Roseicella sp. DB1501]|uniref:HlyD family secretion protein n=1 Tax=Roseicella sp. DB1501 TaxID=2730925 RepID=UPI001492C734|nr:HlyD family efflux transporter periplasmic adaptor subunit [Roseicella sp. DB1501]NOG73889.1 HlyD family secretion protein [Roseicella sp. DB1501]
MLRWIEGHLARSVLIALAVAFLIYEVSALGFAYSADAFVTTDVVVVAPEVAGRILALPVRENDRVAPGAPLLTIEPTPYRLALASAAASLELAKRQQDLGVEAVEEAEAGIASAQAVAADAGAVLDRERSLLRSADVAEQRVDDARRDLAVAEANLRRATAAALSAQRAVQVRAAEVGVAAAARDRSQYELDRTQLLAPAGGRIAAFEARIGHWLEAGQAVMALVTDANWHVVANVTERHLGRIAVGQRAWVMLGSDPWRPHAGRVRSIAPAIARSDAPAGVMPYVPPQTDWVRLPRRFPVEIEVPGLAADIPAFRGGNARVVILH